VTLPTKLRDPDKSQSIAALNVFLMAVLPAAGCQVVNLNPDLAPDVVLYERFTSNGVHLSPMACRLWADRLKPLLP
jgi:lysophospholipase L1-like esterase